MKQILVKFKLGNSGIYIGKLTKVRKNNSFCLNIQYDADSMTWLLFGLFSKLTN